MIHVLPIEPLEQRYTKQFLKWTKEELKKREVSHAFYGLDYAYNKIENGQFLDIGKTLMFKNNQLKQVIEALMSGKISNGDTIFIMDVWFPGMESIRYYTDLMGIKVYIYAMEHAGRSDYTDYIRKCGLWADHSEEGYLNCCDGIFTPAQWTVDLIKKHFNPLRTTRLYASHFIWKSDDVREMACQSSIKLETPYIIFPHRISLEKGIGELYYIADKINCKILVTSSGNANMPYLHPNIMVMDNISKEVYYKLFLNAQAYLCLSYQDHFALTAHEALALRVPILCPNRASYPEYVPKRFLYESEGELLQRINKGFTAADIPTAEESHIGDETTDRLFSVLCQHETL